MWKIGEQVIDSQDSYKILKKYFKKYMNVQEAMYAICFDVRNRPIGKAWLVSLGTVDGVHTYPRDIFREAIKRNAVSIIIAHNHPSGISIPSKEDILLTKKIKEAGDILGIKLLDHLVISRNGFDRIIIEQTF